MSEEKKYRDLHRFKAQGRLRTPDEDQVVETPEHGNLHLIQSLVTNRISALRKLDDHRRLQFKLLSYPNFRLLQGEDDPQTGPLYAIASQEITVQDKILNWLKERAMHLETRLRDLETQVEDAEEHWKKWKKAKDTSVAQEEARAIKREHYKMKKAIDETAQALHYLQALENEWRRELLGISSV